MGRGHVIDGVQPPSLGGWAAPPGPSSEDRAFIALQNAYRPHGGLSRLNGLVAGRRCPSDEPDTDVSDLLEAGMLFGFQWHDDLWIPMFQFNLPGTTAAAGPRRVVAELGCGFDGWDLASWFVQPNCWLASRSPIECLSSHLPDVLEAARADRLATTG